MDDKTNKIIQLLDVILELKKVKELLKQISILSMDNGLVIGIDSYYKLIEQDINFVRIEISEIRGE